MEVVLTKRTKTTGDADVVRWHVHYTNFAFVDDPPRNGNLLLTPVRELLAEAVPEDWPDFDISTGANQFMICVRKQKV